MLLVNVNTKQFIPSPGSNFIQPVESRDQVIYGTRVEVRFQLYNPDGTVFALNESDTFCCAGDINFIHTDDLMFYSGHEMCRIIDAAQGIVGVTIDATSDSFADKATSQNTRMYVQLKRHVAGDTLGDTVLQDIVYAQPAVMTTEGAPASSDPEYMTAAATLALLRTAPDFQFSVDGESGWHDEQDIAADRFYRERRNGGEWSEAIELIEGKTGAAAGFGAPIIAVETLPAGSEATASVTASGDDTAKEFNFNFGIPRGAAGADGVSSYTYVAYASDASGAGFSLTPSNALQFRAEIHTTTAIETPDAADFAGATWVKYIGSNGGGAGDMLKSVYDTNDDGIVDHAAVADAVGATTAAQVADAVSKAHAHANKATLDKLAETGGKLTFDGSEIGGGSGTVKSVNGQLPDESGNVTVETGGAVDETRLLPENPANGDIPCFDATATGGGIDEYTQACFHFDETDGSFKNAVDGSAEYLESTATYSAQGKFDGAAEFSGSQGIKYSKTTALNWGAGKGTVDGWFYPNGIQNNSNALIATPGGWSSGGISIGYDRSNTRKKFSVWMKEASGDMAWSSTEEYPRNAWYHWALVRASSTELLFFANGKKIGTIEIDADREINWAINGGYCSIGYNEADGSGIIGRMDEVRFSNTDRWTEDFTPPAVPYSEQVTEGRWGKLNKSALVQSVNGQTPNGSGAVTLPVATASAAGLMAAADKVKLNNNFTTMTTGTIDFNQLTDVGVYFISGSSEHTNYPGSTAKVGGVLTVQGIGAYRAQSFAVIGSPNQSVTWTRWATSDGSSWTFQPWRKHLIDLDITESKARPGYFKLPGGTIVQWGAATITSDGIYQVTFPLAFPNAIFIGNATAVSGAGDASGVVISISAPQTNRMNIITKNHPGSDQDISVHWLAIGY